MRDEASIMSSSSLGGGEGFFVRYWDETSSVAVLEFKVATPVHSSAASKEKEKKKRAKGTRCCFIFLANISDGSCQTPLFGLQHRSRRSYPFQASQ